MSVVDFSSFSDVQVLAGSTKVVRSPLPVFSHEACLFLEELSSTLLSDCRAKNYPDVISFAYWCRKGNLKREKELRTGRLEGRLGRGLAFHIAPSNVPVNFAFTYAFSLLAGNATIVRCPTKAFDQINIILDTASSLFGKHRDIACRSAFVSYPSNGNATKELSEQSDVRVIWGGDKTVSTVRMLPSRPRCVDIAFPDRYSIAVISASAVLDINDDELKQLAKAFYNDTFLMDQNACSSPQTILWVGDINNTELARVRFWDAIEKEARKRYQLQPAISVNKHVQLVGDIARNVVERFEERDGFLTTAVLREGVEISTGFRGVGGYFYEKHIDGLGDVSACLNEKYQTVVQFGFEMEELRDTVISMRMTGIDRIVKMGNALDIGLIWDGYDLIEAMSRIINVA